jgi:hypothetical protein
MRSVNGEQARNVKFYNLALLVKITRDGENKEIGENFGWYILSRP